MKTACAVPLPPIWDRLEHGRGRRLSLRLGLGLGHLHLPRSHHRGGSVRGEEPSASVACVRGAESLRRERRASGEKDRRGGGRDLRQVPRLSRRFLSREQARGKIRRWRVPSVWAWCSSTCCSISWDCPCPQSRPW